MKQKMNIGFFGTPDIAVWVLDELKKVDLTPSLIVTNPDRPQGRKMVLTPPPVKVWALEHNIEVLQPESLKNKADLSQLTARSWDIFIVVAYGLIMPKWLIDLPAHKTLNVHPSLLPDLRGPSPIRTAILENKRETGVTIMLMDEKMDHGPIVAQQQIKITENQWPMRGRLLDKKLSKIGGVLLADTIPRWISRKIEAQEQMHEKATYTYKFTKDMGALSIDPFDLPTGESAYATLLKIKAFDGNPGTFFMYNGKRIKIVDATLDSTHKLKILAVIPEGKKESSFEYFLATVS